MPTRALSLYAPWCWAILHAGKDIENRSWSPRSGYARFRGDFWIHASLFGGDSPGGLQKLSDEFEGVKTMAARSGRELPGPVTLRMFLDMRGKIVGRARIVDAVEDSSSGWFCGPLGLVLTEPVALPEPLPCKGALGFWAVPPDILEKLRADWSPKGGG
jgi:hypothetical protein